MGSRFVQDTIEGVRLVDDEKKPDVTASNADKVKTEKETDEPLPNPPPGRRLDAPA
jgi:hypothetical protein